MKKTTYIILFVSILIGLMIRYLFLAYGFDSFTSNVIFCITPFVTWVLHDATYRLMFYVVIPVIAYLYKHTNKIEQTTIKEEKPLSPKKETEIELIGKSTLGEKVHLSEIIGNTEEQTNLSNENDYTFAPVTSEPVEEWEEVEVSEDDFQYRYNEFGEESEEINSEDMLSAEGVTFDEMQQAAKVIAEDKTEEKEERLATQTLNKIIDSNLYESLISNYEGARERVEMLMKKYNENTLVKDSAENQLSMFND